MPTFAKQVPWARDPHTAAKHAIYRRYLDRWWPILVRGYSGDATYAEGFAGPGIYDRGESGSPVIALEALLARKELRKLVRRARLLFVDADERCTSLLTRRLQAALPGTPLDLLRDRYHIDIRVELGSASRRSRTCSMQAAPGVIQCWSCWTRSAVRSRPGCCSESRATWPARSGHHPAPILPSLRRRRRRRNRRRRSLRQCHMARSGTGRRW